MAGTSKGHQDMARFAELYNEELAAGRPTSTTKFNYAWCLVTSPAKDDVRKGITLLKELLKEGEYKEDYHYFLAVAHFGLGDYAEAREHVDSVLDSVPDHPQATSLKKEIEDKIAKDGLIGMAIVGGVSAVLGAVALAFMKKK